MHLTRRRLLGLGAGAMAAGALTACSPARMLAPAPWSGSTPPMPDRRTRAVLSRLTFGPRPEEHEHALAIGVDAWIEEQLAPEQIADQATDLRVAAFDTPLLDLSILFDVPIETVQHQLQQVRLIRAVYSRRQLYEHMVEFWTDHFSISIHKGDCAWLKIIDDRETIRPHALGNFRDLLWASMRSPAMLVYLDNQENHASSPNENYARELLELHTLGVGAGYTQADVREVARCLTGWGMGQGVFRGSFRFERQHHDVGVKRVLGQSITDPEQLCALLLRQPATAQLLARKLARRLIADDPPATLVAAGAEAFVRSGGEIKALVRALLPALDGAAPLRKLKRPLEYLAGALRQLDAETDGGAPLLEALARMGQPLFQWPMPDGFPDHSDAWSGGLMARWRFAMQLACGELPGTTIDLAGLIARLGAATVQQAASQLGKLLNVPPDLPMLAALTRALGRDLDPQNLPTLAASLLAAPAYQWR